MHEHNDEICIHDLKICAVCGNVYCAKCNKEWFKEQWTYTPYTIPYTYYPPYITYTTGDKIDVTPKITCTYHSE